MARRHHPASLLSPLLLLLLFVPAVALTCQLRLINEARGYVNVMDSSNTTIHSSAAPSSISDWAPFNCSTLYFVAHSPTFPLSTGPIMFYFVSYSPSLRYTLLVASNEQADQNSNDLVALVGHAAHDATYSLPVSADTIDKCLLRVMNAYSCSPSITVNWGSSDCKGCVYPVAFSPPKVAFPYNGPGESDYAHVDCSRPWIVEVETGDGLQDISLSLPLVEHGVYSLLVHNVWRNLSNGVPGGRGGATLITDVEPPGDPLLPLWLAISSLFGIYFVHSVIGWGCVRFGFVALPPRGRRAGWAAGAVCGRCTRSPSSSDGYGSDESDAEEEGEPQFSSRGKPGGSARLRMFPFTRTSSQLGRAVILPLGVPRESGSTPVPRLSTRRAPCSGIAGQLCAPCWRQLQGVFAFFGWDAIAQAAADAAAQKSANLAQDTMQETLLGGYSVNGIIGSPDEEEDDDGGENWRQAGAAPQLPPQEPPQLHALYFFEGLLVLSAVFAMLGGGGYRVFNYSPWNGLSRRDQVDPLLLFSQGAELAISFEQIREAGGSGHRVARRGLERGVRLVLLGLFVNKGSPLSDWRWTGMLQYFGVCAFLLALIDAYIPLLAFPGGGDSAPAGPGWLPLPVLSVDSPLKNALRSRTTVLPGEPGGVLGVLWRDLGRFALQWVVIFICLGLYIGVMFRMEVPGCPLGYLGAGGYADDGLYVGCSGGASRFLDMLIIGPRHMLHFLDAEGEVVAASACRNVYDCLPMDTEGVLGVLTALTVSFLGLQAGKILHSWGGVYLRGRDDPAIRSSAALSVASSFAAHGLVWCFVGFGLAGFSTDGGGWIPFNRTLMSPSLVMLSGGIAFFMLFVSFFVMDVWRMWRASPLLLFGQHALLLYATTQLLMVVDLI